MDPIVLGFYALICGILGWVAPWLGAPVTRLGIGALVGIAAAAILPTLRGLVGI